MVDISQLIVEATEARSRLLDRIHPLSSVQGAFKADPAEWSIAENVAIWASPGTASTPK